LIPALLSFMGGNRKLASLRQPLAENSHKACAAWRGSRGLKVKSMIFEWPATRMGIGSQGN